jgi:hypothetical protein
MTLEKLYETLFIVLKSIFKGPALSEKNPGRL